MNEIKENWRKHRKDNLLKFSKSEKSQRLVIFSKNSRRIEKNNNKNTDLIMGMNKFGHWTHEEYIEYLVRSFPHPEIKSENYNYQPCPVECPVVDWRNKGLVTRVKDQGQCGSCWAFSATGSLEGQYAKLTNRLVELSEQNLVDCSASYGNNGCNGGLMTNAFKFVKDNGIKSEEDYPYTAKVGECQHKDKKIVLKVQSYVELPSGSENALSDALINVGPVSVGIDASDKKFMFYRSGIYSSSKGSSVSINHGVLAVGLGCQPKKHYIVKNSWGPGWGDNGYILIARDENNMIGIASAACYPIIQNDKSKPKTKTSGCL